MGKRDGLKPFYVYELRDGRDNSVFYVGYGQDDRVFHHEKEASRGAVEKEKLKRIAEINKAGFQVIKIVIGRFETKDEATAVESVLIHWVYGLDKLTNIISGHGVDFIRPRGCYDSLQGIDEPVLGYSERNEENRSRNNILQFLEKIRELIESRCDFTFDGYNTDNPRHTYLYKKYNGVMLTVVSHHRAKHAASVTIEAIDGKKESKARVQYICDHSRLEWKDEGRYGRIMPSGTYTDPEIIFEKFIETLQELEQVPDQQGPIVIYQENKPVEKKQKQTPPSDTAFQSTGWGNKTPWGHRTGAISGMIDSCLYHNENGVSLRDVALACGCPVSRVLDHIKCLNMGKRTNGRKAIITEHVNEKNERCYRLHDGFSKD